MSRMLIIGAEERLAISKLQLLAAATPFDPPAAAEAARRDPDGYRDMMQVYSLMLPFGYAVTYTQERQAVGLCHHISISVDTVHMVPNPAAVEMILEAFGMEPIGASAFVRLETIDPETSAVNIIQLVNKKSEGA